MTRATVLIVDDEANIRAGLGNALRGQDYRLLFADSPAAALEVLAREQVDVVLSDHLMPGMTGLEFLKLVRDRHPDTIRIMLTGHADMATVVKALNEGEIFRFLTKPCDRTELLVTLHIGCEQLALSRENRRLLALIRTSPDLEARLQLEEARRGAQRPARG